MSLWPPSGGNWEGGYTDSLGHQWRHVPWVGWQRVSRPAFFVPAKAWPRWRQSIRNDLKRRLGV